jgi:hypothetical protein
MTQVNCKQSAPNAQGRAKSRLIGPGTVIVIVGLLVFGGWKLFVPAKVTIERRIETSSMADFKRKPSISDLLSWSSDVKLTAGQKHSLEKLLQDEQAEMAPILVEISKATKDFNQYVDNHKASGVNVNEIQKQAAPISELGLKKRQIEQAFAARALALLDMQQKNRAGKLAEMIGIKGIKKRWSDHEK